MPGPFPLKEICADHSLPEVKYKQRRDSFPFEHVFPLPACVSGPLLPASVMQTRQRHAHSRGLSQQMTAVSMTDAVNLALICRFV